MTTPKTILSQESGQGVDTTQILGDTISNSDSATSVASTLDASTRVIVDNLRVLLENGVSKDEVSRKVMEIIGTTADAHKTNIYIYSLLKNGISWTEIIQVYKDQGSTINQIYAVIEGYYLYIQQPQFPVQIALMMNEHGCTIGDIYGLVPKYLSDERFTTICETIGVNIDTILGYIDKDDENVDLLVNLLQKQGKTFAEIIRYCVDNNISLLKLLHSDQIKLPEDERLKEFKQCGISLEQIKEKYPKTREQKIAVYQKYLDVGYTLQELYMSIRYYFSAEDFTVLGQICTGGYAELITALQHKIIDNKIIQLIMESETLQNTKIKNLVLVGLNTKDIRRTLNEYNEEGSEEVKLRQLEEVLDAESIVEGLLKYTKELSSQSHINNIIKLLLGKYPSLLFAKMKSNKYSLLDIIDLVYSTRHSNWGEIFQALNDSGYEKNEILNGVIKWAMKTSDGGIIISALIAYGIGSLEIMQECKKQQIRYKDIVSLYSLLLNSNQIEINSFLGAVKDAGYTFEEVLEVGDDISLMLQKIDTYEIEIETLISVCYNKKVHYSVVGKLLSNYKKPVLLPDLYEQLSKIGYPLDQTILLLQRKGFILDSILSFLLNNQMTLQDINAKVFSNNMPESLAVDMLEKTQLTQNELATMFEQQSIDYIKVVERMSLTGYPMQKIAYIVYNFLKNDNDIIKDRIEKYNKIFTGIYNDIDDRNKLMSYLMQYTIRDIVSTIFLDSKGGNMKFEDIQKLGYPIGCNNLITALKSICTSDEVKIIKGLQKIGYDCADIVMGLKIHGYDPTLIGQTLNKAGYNAVELILGLKRYYNLNDIISGLDAYNITGKIKGLKGAGYEGYQIFKGLSGTYSGYDIVRGMKGNGYSISDVIVLLENSNYENEEFSYLLRRGGYDGQEIVNGLKSRRCNMKKLVEDFRKEYGYGDIIKLLKGAGFNCSSIIKNLPDKRDQSISLKEFELAGFSENDIAAGLIAADYEHASIVKLFQSIGWDISIIEKENG